MRSSHNTRGTSYITLAYIPQIGCTCGTMTEQVTRMCCLGFTTRWRIANYWALGHRVTLASSRTCLQSRRLPARASILWKAAGIPVLCIFLKGRGLSTSQRQS
ncbi:hypothetical protein LPJ62_005650, partial [Coemansia sp. RSA 2167]